MKMCLYNTHSDNIAAWCIYHHCNLTVKQIRRKNCLSKQCHYLRKNEGHTWWGQRESVKQKRKERKEKVRSYGF